jgi:transposase-like protein
METKGICQYCGISLNGMSQLRTRKYCTATCRNKYRLRQKKPEVREKLWAHEKTVFDTAMEMHWSGEESGAIARRLNIPVGTVYSWVHDFGSRRQRREPLKRLLQLAESAEEWLGALREGTDQDNGSFEAQPIHLVCGIFRGGSVDRFTSIIYESLHDNPLNGKEYAFCNKMRNTITTFAWIAPVFQITKHIKMHGTFIWPREELSKTIEVTRAEFERLLFVNKQEILAERMAKSLK